jgi:hypothetical protein
MSIRNLWLYRKKVIELLEKTVSAVMLMGGCDVEDDWELCDEAIDYINEAMALLKSY